MICKYNYIYTNMHSEIYIKTGHMYTHILCVCVSDSRSQAVVARNTD